MRLAVTALGDPGLPPLVILHGLLGSARNWGGIARALADRHRVLAFDLPNHGASPWTERMDYPFQARLVADEIAALGRPVALLGHSMGGKVAMTLALSRPELVGRLVAVDIAPVRYAHSFAPYLRAMRGLKLASLTGREQADAAMAAAVPDPAVRALLLHNLERSEAGWRWRPNLAVLLAEMEEILDFPAALPQPVFAGPALFVTGRESDYVDPAGWTAIRARFPAARRVELAAGHWVHAEAPAAFLEAVAGFLG
ncbi:alpha/beta fold hydrolase [Phaeospirillum tilakii]|uniref:Alpha/beta fold hydrolase n=1 Tax=Phaeospirillum tilakii TaxID=741673 RepID=A0ABW5CGV6_9PROT